MKSGRAKILLSAFFIFLFCPLNASQIEEWQAELDTVRSAERKLELLSLLAQKSPTMDQKIHWAQEWLAFAFEQKNAGAEAHANYILLAARGNMGDFQIVRQEGKEMLKKALAYGDPELVLNAYNIYAGFGYYSLQSFDSAAILYRAALDYAETAKGMLSDSIYAQSITRLYVPIVEVYARTGQNEKYLDTAEEFQAIAYSTENNYAIALANFTAGLSQLRLGQKVKAKETLMAGYRYALKSGSQSVLFNFYTQLFNAYSDLGKLDSAAYFSRLQYEKALELGYENDAYTALYLIAQTEIEQKKYAPALARLTDCLAYFRSVQDHTKTARVEVLSAEALAGLGRAAEALPLVRAAKESAGSITDMLLLNHAMGIEARILFDLKNYKKAYEAFVEYHLFQSAHNRDVFPGTGAGLAIVKRIVERHNGSITLESEGKGKGARFILRLPAEEN